MHDRSHRRPAWVWLAGIVGVLVVGAVAGWATATVLSPSEDVLDATPYTYAEVVRGAVGADFQLNSVAEWEAVPVGANRATGVVTSVLIGAGDEAAQGTVLYTVDLKPVVIAQGDVPAFRTIDAVAEGADVAQLQRMLAATGFYPGAADGRNGSGTTSAIRAWQKSLGLTPSGVVDLGSVIFVPQLPSRVVLDTEVVTRGAMLSGGENVVRGLAPSPSFKLPVTQNQAGVIPSGTRVEITSPDGATWLADASEQTADPQDGTVTISLVPAGGEPICGNQCVQLPVTGQALLLSKIVTVPEVSGLVVPSAALVTDAEGEIAVITEEGERTGVTVIASARGMSVVEGVAAGTRVRMPGNEESR